MIMLNLPVPSDISGSIDALEAKVVAQAQGAASLAADARALAVKRARMTGIVPPELAQPAAKHGTAHITRRALIYHLLRVGLAHTDAKATDAAMRASGITRGRPTVHK